MEKSIRIKASNITNLTDARYFAAYMVDWMGFRFSKEAGAGLNIEDAKTIRDWIVGPEIIAEFDSFDPDFVFQVTDQLGTKNIQLDKMPDEQLPEEYFLFDKPVEVNSKVEAQDMLDKDPDVILQINANPEMIHSILKDIPIQALSIEGSAEEEVGVKSFESINDLFDLLEDF